MGGRRKPFEPTVRLTVGPDSVDLSEEVVIALSLATLLPASQRRLLTMQDLRDAMKAVTTE